MSWLALALAMGLEASPSPAIDIIGRRREAEAVDRPGRSTVIRPDHATRYDTGALLAPIASLGLPETGRITASGFAVPRIRGQDARFTEVYVEDLLLQDPYTGLPVVDDLDLRAFGELALHRGLPPPSLPTVNPIGVVQYRLRPITKPALSAGATGGKPYGLATWLAGDHHEDMARSVLGDLPRSTLSFRGYVRRHRTDGRYPYYSDNGTPYNTTDDATLTREDNARASEQALPYAELRHGRETWRLLALWHHGTTEIPSQSPGQRSDARDDVTSNLGTLSWRRDLEDRPIAPDSLAVTASATEDKRHGDDPDRLVLGARGNARAKVSGRKLSGSATWGRDGDPVLGALHLEGTRARVDTRTIDAESSIAERRAEAATIALSARPIAIVTLEGKGQARRERDTHDPESRDDRLVAPESAQKDRATQGSGLAVGLGTWPGPQAYLQAATQTRAPTLLEEFGDGSLIRGNPELKPERLRHLELGITLHALARWDLAVFEDRVEERITLLPTLGQSFRAANVAKTRVRGVEARATVTATNIEAFVDAVRYEPLDLTDSDDPKLLPGVPKDTATAGIAYTWSPLNARWNSRYQSQTYRDLPNAIAIPAFLIHDLGLDATIPVAKAQLDAGLAVANVLDVRDLPVAAEGGVPSAGRGAYADFAGYPLPGRQWRLAVAARF